MSVLMTPELDAENWPTLGGQVCAFIEENLVFGPGDLRGEPAVLDAEKRALIYRFYEIFPEGHPHAGRRRFRRVAVSLRKGSAKTELAAWIAACELHPDGPVRCDGFDANGEPVGSGVTDPYIPLIAYTEEQSEDLCYGALLAILQECPLAGDFDLGLGRIMRRDGAGKAVALAGAPGPRDGARTTFQIFDEALALDTPIPTPGGWTTMEGVRTGDQIIGTDGTACRVLGKSPVHTGRPCYRVTFTDGTSVVADAGHLWFARRRGGCGHGRGCRCGVSQGWAVRRTEEMLETRHDNGSGHSALTYHVPAGGPIQTGDINLFVDPYVLGLWLGDGDERNAAITVGAEDLEEAGHQLVGVGYKVTGAATVRAPLLYVTTPDSRRGRYGDSLVGRLRSLGLLQNKHIPPAYLRAGLGQRVALMQGLMDSDGHVTEGGWCTFVNTEPRLVAGAAELARTLGYYPSIRWREDGRKESYRRVGKVSFQGHMDVPVFRLKRKRERLAGQAHSSQGVRGIVSVEEVESVPVQCLAVDAPDSLFRAGEGMVLTHNTHRMTLPKQKQAHRTMLANLPKRKIADPWSLEVTTAPSPGQGSVAESTMDYARMVRDGAKSDTKLFFFHRQAGEGHDLETEEGIRAAVIEASGPVSEWSDIDGIVEQWQDPTADTSFLERVWLNRPVQASERAFDVSVWDGLVRENYRPPPTNRITLGFDGARTRDSTALVGCELETGHLFVLGLWERPLRDDNWEVPVGEVKDTVEDAFQTWNVLLFHCDPPYWESLVDEWAGRWDARVSQWWTNRRKPMAYALRAFQTAIQSGELSHDGNDRLRRHIGNSCKKILPMRDEEGRPLWNIQKERPDSPHKIDAAMAAVLAWEARGDVVAAGAMKERAGWLL